MAYSAYSAYDGQKDRIAYQFYTSDFRTFGEKHPDVICKSGYRWTTGDIRFFKRKDQHIADTLIGKKQKYYQLLRKYLLIKQVIPIPELSTIVAHHSDFAAQLLTIVYKCTSGN